MPSNALASRGSVEKACPRRPSCEVGGAPVIEVRVVEGVLVRTKPVVDGMVPDERVSAVSVFLHQHCPRCPNYPQPAPQQAQTEVNARAGRRERGQAPFLRFEDLTANG